MSMTRKWYGAVGLLAAGALSGGILAGSLSANAATSTSPSTAPSVAQGAPRAGGGHAGETVVTGANAATLKAAALKAVPGATVDRAETDSGDAAYEVHMTKSDGSQVTVKFDKALKVTGVEAGMGK